MRIFSEVEVLDGKDLLEIFKTFHDYDMLTPQEVAKTKLYTLLEEVTMIYGYDITIRELGLQIAYEVARRVMVKKYK